MTRRYFIRRTSRLNANTLAVFIISLLRIYISVESFVVQTRSRASLLQISRSNSSLVSSTKTSTSTSPFSPTWTWSPSLPLKLSSNSMTDDLSPSSNSNILSSLANKKILVVGGSGRVGGSVCCQLLRHDAQVTVGGTNVENFQESKERWKQLFPSFSSRIEKNVSFMTLDREDSSSVVTILKGGGRSVTSTVDSIQEGDFHSSFDLVVHTAGPFQGKVKTPNGVIEGAVEMGVPYIDVCDDYCTASAAKSKYSAKAVENGVSCILSTGCWPGVSSLMAKQLTSSVLSKNKHLSAADLTVDFSFFTAGSGGAGATLLVATFLILAEKSLMVVNGRRREVQAMKEYSSVNFGNVVGSKDVAHLNLLEAASVHDVLGVGNVKTLFGTAPGFWNSLLGVMAQLPSSLLANEQIMERLAIFSLPIVRVVDYFAGATNAMRCDVSCSKDPSIQEMALYAHENLEPCVGECVVAFCVSLLSDSVTVKPGVWFPEEAINSGDDAAKVLNMASIGAHTVEVESSSKLSKEEVWGSREARSMKNVVL